MDYCSCKHHILYGELRGDTRETVNLATIEQMLLLRDSGLRLTSLQQDNIRNQYFLQFKHQSVASMNGFTADRLKEICKHYTLTYSNKRKVDLILVSSMQQSKATESSDLTGAISKVDLYWGPAGQLPFRMEVGINTRR